MAERNAPESVASSTATVNGLGNVSGMSCGTNSSGWPCPSEYFFRRQLLSAAPLVVNTADTVSVSTRMSFAAASFTTGALGVGITEDGGFAAGAAGAGAALGPGVSTRACGGVGVAGAKYA